MTGAEFVERASTALGGKRGWQQRFCKATGIAGSTVRRWANGEIPLPDYAVALVELLERIPAAFRPARWVD